MKKFVVACMLMLIGFTFQGQSSVVGQPLQESQKLYTYTLENGLTVLVCPQQEQAIVAVQLWYNVGSKHEKDGERGIAHFIEHLIFKGTEKLSESDIPAIASKLSGDCNAFTSYDYTGYRFDIPVANWDKVLPVMADCMQHCTFKQEHINSEVKAVIQELKMNRDNYTRSMWFEMITNLFESHPYHFPIIGYKQDLWSVSRDTLVAFYKKYYTPDNAVLVIVGDVNPQEVYQKAVENFGSIPAGQGWNQQAFYMNEDVKSKKITLYRKVAQPACSLVYLMPGYTANQMFEMEALSCLLAGGKGSRLSKLLIDKLGLVTQVNSLVIDLFDKSLFWIDFTPQHEKDIQIIIQHIQHELDEIALGHVSEQEIRRAHRLTSLAFQRHIQNPQACAYALGQAFVATRNPHRVFEYGANVTEQQLAEKIQDLVVQYGAQVHCHQGTVFPILGQCEKVLQDFQKRSDEQDTLFLGLKPRDAVVEPVKYTKMLEVQENKQIQTPQFYAVELENGLQTVWYHNPSVDFIDISLELSTNFYYDNADQQGISHLVSSMMLEGTKNYEGQAFCDELDSYGISLNVQPGLIQASCLKQDLEKLLLLLTEMLTQTSFQESAFEKVKARASAKLKKFWDTPSEFGPYLARQLVYKNHPYAQLSFGSQEALENLTLQDCVAYYKKHVTPYQARFALAGNLEGYDIAALIQKVMGHWQAQEIEKPNFPSLSPVQHQEITHAINRDQTILEFVGLSVDIMHADYDKILLFDQILIGSSVNPMSSRLFDLRQRSGLFYTVGGSLLYAAGEQPGMIFIRTLVSNDRVQEAINTFLEEFSVGIDAINEDDLAAAKKAVIDSFALAFDSNADKLAMLQFLKKYDLPADYFEQRIAAIQNFTLEEVKVAVKNILDINKLAVIKIGRE